MNRVKRILYKFDENYYIFKEESGNIAWLDPKFQFKCDTSKIINYSEKILEWERYLYEASYSYRFEINTPDRLKINDFLKYGKFRSSLWSTKAVYAIKLYQNDEFEIDISKYEPIFRLLRFKYKKGLLVLKLKIYLYNEKDLWINIMAIGISYRRQVVFSYLPEILQREIFLKIYAKLSEKFDSMWIMKKFSSKNL